MPEGISAIVEDGFATISFLDPAKRGVALGKLIKDVGPEFISVDTSGTRKKYIVLESAARAAGLLDADPASVSATLSEQDQLADKNGDGKLSSQEKAARTRAANKAREDAKVAAAAKFTEAESVPLEAKDDEENWG